MRVILLDDWTNSLRTLPSFAYLAGHDVTVLTEHIADEERLIEAIGDAEALVLFRERSRISSNVINTLPRLRHVSLRGATGHLDVAACTVRGVVVSSLPSASSPPHATAELTLLLVLAALRRLPENVQAVKSGRWQASAGRQLHGRTLGVWSYGRLGAEVARLGAAFGARVIVHGSEPALARAAADGHETIAERARIFADSDVLSVHLRLSEATHGIIDADLLGGMRSDAIFVNTSRAALVAPGALEAALERGRPGGAALDVFDAEPLLDPDHPLLADPRVIATPHLGFVTEEELEAQFADVFAQVAAFARGAPINVVNPEALQNW